MFHRLFNEHSFPASIETNFLGVNTINEAMALLKAEIKILAEAPAQIPKSEGKNFSISAGSATTPFFSFEPMQVCLKSSFRHFLFLFGNRTKMRKDDFSSEFAALHIA